MISTQYWFSSLTATALALAMACPAVADTPSPGGRYALVIGNSGYGGKKEVSGEKEARTLHEYLNKMGFTVLPLVVNSELDEMRAAVDDLGKKIEHASSVIFFYSGHGFQADQENYLMPIGGSTDPDRALAFSYVLTNLAKAPREAVKIVFLDACRDNLEVQKKGFANPGVPPQNTLYAFATGYGQAAASGSRKEYSPYSEILLSYIREPGLEIRQLLAQVHRTLLEKKDQASREEGLDNLPSEFYLVPPVEIRARLEGAPDDDLLVFLNDKVVLSWARNKDEWESLRLGARDNEIKIVVFNQNTHRNQQTWNKTEGWNYKLRLGVASTELPCDDGKPETCFHGEEPVPFKDGPHMGSLFTVATATLNVNPESAELSLARADLDVWNREAPEWARDQDILWEQKIPFTELWIRVRGNLIRKPEAENCMKDSNRLTDLVPVALAAVAGNPTPFDQYIQSLSDCVGMPVWMAVEDQP